MSPVVHHSETSGFYLNFLWKSRRPGAIEIARGSGKIHGSPRIIYRILIYRQTIFVCIPWTLGIGFCIKSDSVLYLHIPDTCIYQMISCHGFRVTTKTTSWFRRYRWPCGLHNVWRKQDGFFGERPRIPKHQPKLIHWGWGHSVYTCLTLPPKKLIFARNPVIFSDDD